ncbi:MAG: hypothetical protein FJ098_06085 [Deltaproteobacteria bacterium]|nr:hypothetical protein [Deltaproteobacteria bacterium]
MKAKAFIVEFQGELDFVQSFRTLLRNERFVLRTRVPLELGERVKIRFNTPDGNGVTIRCKVAAQLDDEAWGVTLPAVEDTRWLQEKALECEKKLGPAAASWLLPEAPPVPWETRPVPPRPPEQAGAGLAPPSTAEALARAATGGPRPDNGPATVDIAPISGPETLTLRFNAPVAEYVDPDHEGFPTLKDTGLDLIKQQGDLPGAEPVVVRQVAGDVTVGITQVVRGKAGEGPAAGDVPPEAIAVRLPPGDSGIDFPHGVRRPSPEGINRIQGMSLTQKKQLAISGTATERMILMGDRERTIQLWVLKNPQITEAEIRWLSSLPSLTQEAVAFLVGNRKWSSMPDIAVNLLANPATPNEAIQRLLAILPNQVLAILTQKPGVRPLVSDQAKKLLLERGEL